jgi:hypothetical protein
MPDAPEVVENKAVAAIPVADVKDLVDSFKATLEGVKDTIAAIPHAPAAPVADPSIARAAALDEYNKTRDKVNELVSAGDAAGAMEAMYGAFGKLNAATAPSAESDPSTQALISNAKRSSRADNKPMFDKYGSEIESLMQSRPLAERISPDAWDKAARDVRAMHFDDILAETKTGWEAEQKAAQDAAEARARGFRTPVAGGGASGTVSAGISASELSPEQIAVAAAFGKTPEQYAESVSKYEKALIRPGRVAILDEPIGNRVIERGKF